MSKLVEIMAKASENVLNILNKIKSNSELGKLSSVGQMIYTSNLTLSEKEEVSNLMNEMMKATDFPLEVVTTSPLLVKLCIPDDTIVDNIINKQGIVDDGFPLVHLKGKPFIHGKEWISDLHNQYVFTGLNTSKGFQYAYGKELYWDPLYASNAYKNIVVEELVSKDKDGNGYLKGVYKKLLEKEVDMVTTPNKGGKYTPMKVASATLDQRGRVYWKWNTGELNINSYKGGRFASMLPQEAWKRLSPEGEKWLMFTTATMGSKKEFSSVEERIDYGRSLLEENYGRNILTIEDPEERNLVANATRWHKYTEDSTFQWKWPVELDMTASVITILATALHDTEALKLIGVIPENEEFKDGWTALADLAWERGKGTLYETKKPAPRAMVKAITTTIYGVGDLCKKIKEDFPDNPGFEVDPGLSWEQQRSRWSNQLLTLSTTSGIKPLWQWKNAWSNARGGCITTVDWLYNKVSCYYTKPVENTGDTDDSIIYQRYLGLNYNKLNHKLFPQTEEGIKKAIAKAVSVNPNLKISEDEFMRKGIMGRKIDYTRKNLFWPSFSIHGLDAMLASILTKKFRNNAGFVVTNHDAYFMHPNLAPSVVKEGNSFLEWVWNYGEEVITNLAKSLGVEAVVSNYFNHKATKPDFSKIRAFK